jgi:subtilase family serine protease
VLALLAFAISAPAQIRSRIAAGIDDARTPMRGNVHPLARKATDAGPVAASMPIQRVTIFFSRTAEQQKDLEKLLSDQQDSASAHFHNWLTPEQYGGRFGLSESDLNKVTGWLEGQGFQVVEKARSRTYVVFSGTASQVRSAFGTEIHQYRIDGKLHFANASEPSLPPALANVVLGFRALNDFRPKPKGIRTLKHSVRPEFTSSISGNHFLSPDDVATIYGLKPLYDQGIDGSGQKLAIMGQTDIVLSDIQTFRSVSGLPAGSVQVVLVPVFRSRRDHGRFGRSRFGC